jgi:hypothetical protein
MTSVVGRRPFKLGGATVDPVSRDARWREALQPQTVVSISTESWRN